MKTKLFLFFTMFYGLASAQPYCTGTQTVTACTGSITDGSGPNNYANNTDCYWLIQPTGATAITLSFAGWDIDSGDFLTVYDGDNTSATIIGTYSIAPPAQQPLVSSQGSMLIHFYTNASGAFGGWQANFSCTSNAGINETDFISSKIYPNPFHVSATIEFGEPLQNAELQIYNLQGQKLRTMSNICGNSVRLERDGLPSGAYFIRIMHDSRVIIANRMVIIE